VFATIGQGHPHSRAFPNLNRGPWDDNTGWPRRCCVRTDQYRLDRNERINDCKPTDAQRDVFLTDWRADPRERTNLANDLNHAGVRERLMSLLDAHTANARETQGPPR